MKKSISIILSLILIFISIMPINSFASEVVESIQNDLYKINMPSWVKILHTNSDNDYSTILSDNELSFTLKISFEKINSDELHIVRDYIGDFTSDNSVIMDKIIDLKASSYEAVEKSFENSSLFYPLENDYSEYNFKIIDKQIQNLFGKRSFSIMYNTLDATLNNVSEFSKIDLYIPSYDNTGIYNINIIIPRDNLDIKIAMKFSEILTSLELKGHSKENKIPLIFISNSNLEKSSSGIYPAFTFKNYNLKPYYSKEMGLSFLYPDFLIPTEEVTSFEGIQSASFKIDPYTNFNISISDSKFYSINEAIAAAFTSVDDNITLERTNFFNSHIGNILEIKYSFYRNNIKYSRTNYIMSYRDRTITYTFTSNALSSTYSIDNIAIRIIMTTKIFEIPEPEIVPTFEFRDYEFENVLVSLPKDFEIENIGGNNRKISSPDISTFKIYIYEEKLYKSLDFQRVSRLASADYDIFNNIIENRYPLPFNNYQNKYLGGSFSYDEKSSKVQRLVKYLDESNRIHYGYLLSISKDDKLYSMLIDMNSAVLKEDGLVGKTLPGVLNEIIKSFELKE